MLTLLLVLAVIGPFAVWCIASLLVRSDHERRLRALDVLRALREIDSGDLSGGRQPGSDDPGRTQQVATGNELGCDRRLLPGRID